MKLLVAHWYESRGAVTAATTAPLALGVDALLWPYKAC